MDEGYVWPMLALVLVASSAWEWFSGVVRLGRLIEIDRDDSEAAFIMITGLKCVLAILIMTVYFFGAD